MPLEQISPVVRALAALLTGIVSGFGIGGGTLLIIFLTLAAKLDQRSAQGMNLLYFIPTASASLIFHCKNGRVDKKVWFFTGLAGVATAVAASYFGARIDTGLLRRLFGILLLYVGIRELFAKKEKERSEPPPT